MKIGPRYKIARRLGADVFPKTLSPKYAMRAGKPSGKSRFARSEFSAQLREKQRARMLYGIMERQFARYIRNAVAMRGMRDDEALYRELETRMDNVIYRLGCAPSRQAARQMVSHGHFTVNGVRVTIPSYRLGVGDVLRLRSGSERKPLFANLADRVRDTATPPWLRFDLQKGDATIVGLPRMVKSELPFDIGAVLEFYRR